MPTSFIQKLYEDFKSSGQYHLPAELMPPEKGYILTKWVRELFIHYQDEGIVARALDDLPPLKLSNQPGLNLSLQHIHKFIIGEQNLIPLEAKKNIVAAAIGHSSSQEAWEKIVPLLLHQWAGMNRETVQEEVSWKFSPVGEALWVITWFFMEREGIQPPKSTKHTCERFPYYTWTTAMGNENPGQISLWETDNCLCRWEWLANDLFYHWLQTDKAP
jgi:hypothetical protein